MEEEKTISYQLPEGSLQLNVKIDQDTVWLTIEQMSFLFGKSRATINEHILNIFKEKELEKEDVTRKIGNSDFPLKPTNYYNLDVIISVGYRVKSPQGSRFRIWANKALKEYLLKGYAIHRPVSKQELDALRTELEAQINNMEIFNESQFVDIYALLLRLLEKPQKENNRQPIGFKTHNTSPLI